MVQGLVSATVNTYGLKRALRRVDPKRVLRARDRALNKGSAHLVRVIRAESRVKSGTYKGGWITRKHGESHTIVNVVATYPEFVTGNTMATTLSGGRRRGAGAAFMRKIHRENSMAVRRIMQELVREIATG